MASSAPLYSALFCPACRKQSPYLHIDSAVIVSGIPRRTLYRWMKRGWIHWRTLPNGQRLLCQECLTGRSGDLPRVVTKIS